MRPALIDHLAALEGYAELARKDEGIWALPDGQELYETMILAVTTLELTPREYDLLVFFATLPQGMPAVRKMIDYVREVNALPGLQIMCCGGIYKRAEGLAEEIGADLYAADAADAVRIANEHPSRRASVEQQTVGRTRRIKKAEIRRRQQTQRIAPRIVNLPQSEAA